MLTTVAFVATIAFIAAGFAVGARLLVAARATRELPETTLGLGLLLLVGVGYPLLLGGRALIGGEDPGVGARAMLAAGNACMQLGWCSVWVFTWRVFRAESVVAGAVARLAIAALVLLAGVQAWLAATVDDPTSLLNRPALGMSTLLLANACYLWTAAESLHWWTMLRRRVALGLGDVVAANRMLLWALVAIFSILSVVAPTVAAVRGIDVSEDPWVRLSTAVTGSVCALALTLAFLPPAGYLRWVRGRAPAPR